MTTGRDLIVLATEDGVVACRRSQHGWKPVVRSLTGHRVTAIVAREGIVLAGTRDGIYRSHDRAKTWQPADYGLSIRLVRWLAYHPDVSDREYAGTEPAGIFVSHDGGDGWRACSEVEQMRDRGGWFLPYSPLAGCVRGFAFHGSRVYAAVEVGGVLQSNNGGESWRMVDGASGMGTLEAPDREQVHSDVHSVASHSSSPDIALAATSGGLYRTLDGGDRWELLYAGSYCRAVWIDPADACRIVLGPAEGVGKKGRIEESQDGGKTWTGATEGLDLPWPHRMVERFFEVEEALLAVTNDGRVYRAPISNLGWSRVFDEVEGVAALASL